MNSEEQKVKTLSDIRNERKKKMESNNDQPQETVEPITETFSDPVVEAPKKKTSKKSSEPKRVAETISEEDSKMLSDSFQKLREQISQQKQVEKEKAQNKKAKEKAQTLEYQKTIDELNEKIDELQKSNAILEENMTKGSLDNEETQKQQQMLDELNEKLSSLEQQILESQKVNEELQNKNEELQNKNEELQNKNEELQSKNEEVQKNYQELTNKNNELESEYQKALNANEHLEQSIDLKQEVLDDTNLQLTELREKLEKMPNVNDYDDLRIELSDSKELVESLTKENEEIKEELENYKNNAGNVVIQESLFNDESISKLEQENFDLKNANSKIQSENEDLKEQLKLTEEKLKVNEEEMELLVSQNNILSQNNEDEDDVSALKKILNDERQHYAELNGLYNSLEESSQKRIEELEDLVEDKNLEIEDLNENLKNYKNNLSSKNDEVMQTSEQYYSLNSELSDKKHEIDVLEEENQRLRNQVIELKQSILNGNSNSKTQQVNEKNADLEKRIDYLTDLVQKLQDRDAQKNYAYDQHYEQMNQLRMLRDEMNSRFSEQKQEKYVDEIRKLKEELINLNEKMRKESPSYPNTTPNNPNMVNNVEEFDTEDNDLGFSSDYEEAIESVVDEKQEYHYEKSDITNPRFLQEYNKLEKAIKGFRLNIEEDTRRFNQATIKNNEAIKKRRQTIDEINQHVDSLIERYNNSQGDSVLNKEIYEKEQVKAGERIRFLEEKIRSLNESNNDAAILHEEYVLEKERQIERLKQEQEKLLTNYGNQLLEKGILPKNVKNKSNSANIDNGTVDNGTVDNINVASTVSQPNVSFSQPVLQTNVAVNSPLQKEYDYKMNALKKFKAEYDRCSLLEQELRTGDNYVTDYCKYSQSISGLKADLNQIRIQKAEITSKIDEYIGDSSKRSQMLSLRARKEDIEIREQDLLSKINYSSTRLKEVSKDPQVQKYIELVNGMKNISYRMNKLKSEILKLKQQLGK